MRTLTLTFNSLSKAAAHRLPRRLDGGVGRQETGKDYIGPERALQLRRRNASSTPAITPYQTASAAARVSNELVGGAANCALTPARRPSG